MRPPAFIGELSRHRVELGITAVLVLVAAVPRLVQLGDIPPGFDGDEAIAGLEARRILDGGSIGPYTGAALGVPTGTFYWTALVLGLLPDGAFAVRLAFALLGIATVVVSYLAFRVMFTRSVAVIATALLSTSAWHLHYSRVAFIPIGWPLMQMLTLLLFFLGLRHRSKWLFAAAGAALGAGAYTYQGFLMFAAALAVFVIYLALVHYRRDLRWFVERVAVTLGVALLAGLPMASYARDNPDVYLGRFREHSVTRTEGYRDAGGPFEKAGVLAGRELDYVRQVLGTSDADVVDAAGVFPFVNRVMLVLLVAGGILAAMRWRDPSYAGLITIAFVIGVAPALAEDGWYRRTLGVVPLLAAFAALPLAFVWDEAVKRGPKTTAIAGIVVLGTAGGVAGIDLGRYFGTYDEDPVVKLIYGFEIAEASEYLSDLPEGTFVYYYDDVRTFDFETRRFLAPDAAGEDRSIEFGGDGAFPPPDRSRPVVYLLLRSYSPRLGEVAALYPGGDAYRRIDPVNGGTVFASYFLPAER